MAEGRESLGQDETQGENAVPISGITTDLLLGQSKFGGDADGLLQFSALDDPGQEKNKLFLICKYCKCKVMRPGYGVLMKKEIFLPDMTSKYEIGTKPSGDNLTQFWLVEDMFHFENIGFSKDVDGTTVKYLICADCEVGPIGWHDTRNRREFLVAAERVVYGTS